MCLCRASSVASAPRTRQTRAHGRQHYVRRAPAPHAALTVRACVSSPACDAIRVRARARCAVSPGVAYAYSADVPSDDFYWFMLLNCADAGASVDASLQLLNPGGENLSAGEIPYKAATAVRALGGRARAPVRTVLNLHCGMRIRVWRARFVVWCLITPAVRPASAWCASCRATPHTSTLGVGHQIVAGVWAAAALLWGVLGARACARSRCTSLHWLLLALPCGAAAGACVAWLVRERRALRQRAHASAQGSRRCTGGS